MSQPDPNGPQAQTPLVSVVVPCRNEISHIHSCLESIFQQQPVPGGFEVIVADGMSDDGTREVLARLQQEVGGQSSTDSSAGDFQISGLTFPPLGGSHPSDGFSILPLTLSPGALTASRSTDVPSPASNPRPYAVGRQCSGVSSPVFRVIDNPRRITPCGMNVGIRAARGKWIAIMGAHARYAPDYLAHCLEVARQIGADNVGGAMRCEGKTTLQRAIAAAHHSPFAVGGARWHDPDYEGPADTVFGGFYKREVFDRIGLFDESLARNQDDEFNLRLTRSGGRIWHSPKIRSWYTPRSSLSALFRQYYQYGYWKVRVIQKHRLPASWRHLVPATFVFTLLCLFLLSAFSFLHSGPGASSPQFSGFKFHPSSVTHYCFLLGLATYLAAALAASLITAAKTEWKSLPLLPFVFPCYHFGYGVGFLRGVIDFVILRRGGSHSFTSLTR